jgi:hypothetical protein
MKFLDGTLVPPDSLKQVGDLIDQTAAFEESLTPEELEGMEREIERKRRGE